MTRAHRGVVRPVVPVLRLLGLYLFIPLKLLVSRMNHSQRS
jgi:hypothetical protein